MTIKKRKHIPNLTTQADPSKVDDIKDGRSVELQGQRYDVWQFIRDNAPCTRDDVSRGLGMKSSTATARIRELVELGYVVEPPTLRKMTKAGVNARCLVLSDRPASGRVNDRVQVEVTLTIDHNGVYGATARVVHGRKQSGRVTPISHKRMTFVAPPIASYAASVDDSNVAPVSRLQLQVEADQIIDADYKILDVDPD